MPVGAEPGSGAVRYRSLDGLRGLAAFVVLLHHSLLVIPALANPYATPPGRAHGWWASWLVYSPLHILWAGPQAVFLFFVLSGFVLVLPATRRTMHYRSYYPQRLLRLYLPIWGALIVAAVVVKVVPRTVDPSASWWLNKHAFTMTVNGLAHDATLLRGNTAMNTAVWSLKWEIIFSLLLPIYLIFARGLSSLWLVKIGLCLLATGLGQDRGNGYLTYLPMFAIGSVLAFEEGRLRGYVATLRARRWPRTMPWLLLVLSVLLVPAQWLLSVHAQPARIVMDIATVAELVGVVVVLLLFLYWPGAIRVGESASIQWLGRRSFSLYLVHEPLVVSIAILLGPHWAGATILIAVPVSLAAAAMFYRFIEGPSHRLSQAVGARLRQLPSTTARTSATV